MSLQHQQDTGDCVVTSVDKENSSSLRMRSCANSLEQKMIQDKLAGVSSTVCCECARVTSKDDAIKCDKVECPYD